MADLEKLIKKIRKAYAASWDEGYDAGYEVGFSDGSEDARESAFQEGIQAHKDHVQSRLKFSEELAMSAGKGAEAVRMREMAEFLAFEYDPEKAEADAKADDENWF